MNIISHISNHSLLFVRGLDARKFLQGQVTCDINKLNPEEGNTEVETCLGAHCTHKGRVVFTFRAIALDEQTIALSIPEDNFDLATTALKKYIVFSKAEIINPNDEYQLLGIHGESAHTSIKEYLGQLPSEPHKAINNNKGIAIYLSANRYELWLSKKQWDNAQKHFEKYSEVNSQYWDFANINDRFAEIRKATSELFTPHAINLQTTGNGVSFKKGCYTGQEVVARMHYLGKPKRQMFLFKYPLVEGQKLPAIGDPLYSPEKSQSIGNIVSIATHNNEIRLLASVTVEQATENQVYSEQSCQIKLHLLTDEN